MTAIYGSSERDTRAFQATERGDSARRFRAAKRHSRHVRMLRIAIPVAILVAGGGIALSTWFNPLRILARLPAGIGDVVISGTKIKMENPRLSGFTRDSRRYDLTAEAAAQDLTRPGMIELQGINATVEMDDTTSMKISAAEGLFDTKSEILTLDRNIVVTSSNGYEGNLQHAVVDTHTGNVVSDKPVTVKMLDGTVNANRLEILEAGDLIRFDKGVAVKLRLDSPAPANSPPRTTP
jgi:lipopolysaccharide export system protein LptC